MDWASMVMQMYKSWAQRRGYVVTLMDEMPGEIAGIKVHLLTYHLPLSNFVKTYYCVNYSPIAEEVQ